MREVCNLGTIFKYAIGLDCAGLTAKDFDFTAKFWIYSDKYVEIPKSDLLFDEDSEQYIAAVDTTLLSEGEVKLTITATIPDDDMQAGERMEIASIRTGIYLKRRV